MTDYRVSIGDDGESQDVRLDRAMARGREERQKRLSELVERERREQQLAFQTEVVNTLQSLVVATRQTHELLTKLNQKMSVYLTLKSQNLQLEKETLTKLNQYLKNWL